MRGGERTPMPGGDLEFALLAALWARADREASGRALHDEVGESRGIVYTTVAKVLDRLVDEGLVRRRRVGGQLIEELGETSSIAPKSAARAGSGSSPTICSIRVRTIARVVAACSTTGA